MKITTTSASFDTAPFKPMPIVQMTFRRDAFTCPPTGAPTHGTVRITIIGIVESDGGCPGPISISADETILAFNGDWRTDGLGEGVYCLRELDETQGRMNFVCPEPCVNESDEPITFGALVIYRPTGWFLQVFVSYIDNNFCSGSFTLEFTDEEIPFGGPVGTFTVGPLTLGAFDVEVTWEITLS